MKKIIHRAETRGQSKNDWLNSKHNFSFADYSDRDRIHFGALRVLNDDVVQPGKGFGKHPHDNMEIISIPLNGSLAHKDSMDHEQIINENEVQVMSAGTGLFHSEFNASTTEEVNFLQLWIYPNKKNVSPSYNQQYFDREYARNKWQVLVTSSDEGGMDSLKIQQNAKISRSLLQTDYEINYVPARTTYGCFLFVVEGEVEIDGNTFGKRDAIGIENEETIKLKAKSESYILCVEVPKIK